MSAAIHFYLSVTIATVLVISALLLFGCVPRWAGAALVLIYAEFVAGGYLLYGTTPTGG